MHQRHLLLGCTVGLFSLLGCVTPSPSTRADSAQSAGDPIAPVVAQVRDSISADEDSTHSRPLTEDEAVAEAMLAESLAQRQAVARLDSFTRKLPPSAYAQLPARVRQALEDASCLIPQVWGEEGRQNNVIIADLLGNHHRSAAILCLVDTVSVVYVFDLDSLTPPELVGSHPAQGFVEARIDSNDSTIYRWNRSISVIGPKEAADWCLYPDPGPAHEGIIDFKLQELVGAYYLRSPGRRWSDCHVPDGD